MTHLDRSAVQSFARTWLLGVSLSCLSLLGAAQTPLPSAGEVEELAALTAKAEAGDADAALAVGLHYGRLRDYVTATTWFERAANGGNAQAMSYMGEHYALGLGVEADEAKAFSWFRKAAESGHVEAMLALAKAHCIRLDVLAFLWKVTSRCFWSSPFQ